MRIDLKKIPALRAAALFLFGGFAATMQGAPAAAGLPPPYEDLVQVKSRKLDAVYLLPGADFRSYTKVMIDPVEVSFRQDWMQETNRSRNLERRISDSDAQQIAQAARSGFKEIFAAAFQAKGYEVVSEPARGVLRLSPAIVNLYINAPKPMAGRAQIYTVEAGEATLVLQVRDSTTGATLGVAIDRSSTRNAGRATLTTPTSNRADFEELFRRWSEICVKGFEALRTVQPAQGHKAK